MRMLFIHRSVGRDLLEEGNFRKLLNAWYIRLDDYDNNSGVLTYDDGTAARGAIAMPGNNTDPDNLAAFFAGWPELLNTYDAIIVKSCYPNSRIKNTAALETVQTQYISMLASCKAHGKLLIILTTPPLRPLRTSAREATLASQLASWLVDLSDSDDGLYVFDFHHALAEPSGPQAGMLKRAYRRTAPWDNHPNALAHQTLAPLIADFIGSLEIDSASEPNQAAPAPVATPGADSPNEPTGGAV